MPQALAIDHDQVRAVALQVGVRESARQFHLSEHTVKSWSSREQWFAHRALIDKAVEQQRANQGLQPVAPKASDVLEHYGRTTRVAHAKAASKIAEKVAQLAEDDAGDALARIVEILAAGKHAALVHGWAATGISVGVRLDQIAASSAVFVEIPADDEDAENGA